MTAWAGRGQDFEIRVCPLLFCCRAAEGAERGWLASCGCALLVSLFIERVLIETFEKNHPITNRACFQLLHDEVKTAPGGNSDFSFLPVLLPRVVETETRFNRLRKRRSLLSRPERCQKKE